jgi:hypothetical protein
MIARTLRLALIVALVGAWQNALHHPLEHRDSLGGFVHVAGGHAPDGSGKQGGPEALCDAIAEVGVCLGGAQPSTPAAVRASERLPDTGSDAALGASPPAYRSQAPPSLL